MDTAGAGFRKKKKKLKQLLRCTLLLYVFQSYGPINTFGNDKNKDRPRSLSAPDVSDTQITNE
jgi:hypothetical protein